MNEYFVEQMENGKWSVFVADELVEVEVASQIPTEEDAHKIANVYRGGE